MKQFVAAFGSCLTSEKIEHSKHSRCDRFLKDID